MKYQLISIAVLFVSLSYGQNSEIRIERASEPEIAINGQTIQIYSETYTVYAYLKIVNISANTIELYWQRNYCTGNPNLVGEQFCDNWTCSDLPTNQDSWTVSNPKQIEAEANSVFEPKVVFQSEPCDSALICYYILNSEMEVIDSIKIQFFYINPNLCAELVNISISDISNIVLYPNPSNGQITVKDAPAGSEIEVTDMVGKVVFKAKLNGATQSFDLSKNPDGVYFYTIRSADGQSTVTKRLVIRK